MSVDTPSCPSNAQMQQFLAGNCSDDDQLWIDQHLDQCTDCQSRIETLSADAEWERLMPADGKLRIDPDHPSQTTRHTTSPAPTRQVPPPDVPGYTILEPIGRGGMGTVYRATQHSVNRTVALKILHGTAVEHPARWLRFKTEIEAIGRLQHTNIVRVFDAGEHAGRAYVCQELCDRDSLGARTGTPQPPQQVATIIGQLASAVDHAHRQDVLHRDIKPSNILFSNQTPKLADFGLAKLTDSSDDLTRTQDVVGTPSYMAPEQTLAEHETIGPQTDIFQLGILMYELLTGVPPFLGETAVETLRLVQEHDPVAPRRLQPSIPRDLQTICLKCLSKTPQHRYSTAEELALDLQRFQSGHAILAKPPGVLTRVWKWTCRRPAAATLIIVSAIAVVSLLVMWAWFTQGLSTQTQIAEQKTKEAQRRLQESIDANTATQEVLSFFTTDLLDSANPENDGAGVTVIDVLEHASNTIEQRFTDRPAVEAPVRAAIGNLFYELGQPLKAVPHMERAVAVYNQLDSDSHKAAAFDARYQLALCLEDLNRGQEARDLIEELKPLAEELGIEKQLELRFHETNGMLHQRQLDETLKIIEALHAECVQELGNDHRITMGVFGQLIVAHVHLKNFEKAEQLARTDFETRQEVLGEDDPDTLIALNNLAITLVRQNKLAESEELQRESLKRKQRSLGEQHFGTIGQKHNLAMVVWRQGRHQEATDLLQDVITSRSEVYGAADRRTLESTYQAGRMYLVMKDYDTGTELYDRVLSPLLTSPPTTGQWVSLLTVWSELKARGGASTQATDLLNKARQLLTQNPTTSNPSRQNAIKQVEALLSPDPTNNDQ